MKDETARGDIEQNSNRLLPHKGKKKKKNATVTRTLHFTFTVQLSGFHNLISTPSYIS